MMEILRTSLGQKCRAATKGCPDLAHVFFLRQMHFDHILKQVISGAIFNI